VSCRLCHSAHVEAVFSRPVHGAAAHSTSIGASLAVLSSSVTHGWITRRYTAKNTTPDAAADPLVNYTEEITTFRDSVRLYEWRGIREVVGSLIDLTPDTAWLDYGCGAGGLVRYLNQTGVADALGFEQSWAVSRLRSLGVPLLDDSARGSGEDRFRYRDCHRSS